MGMKASNVKLTRRALKPIFRVTEIAAERDRSKKKSMNYSKLFEPRKIGKLTLKNRFIAGAGFVGLECADFLRERGGRVCTIIDRLPTVNYGVLGVDTHLHERLDSIGISYILGASIERFTDDGVIYTVNGERKEAHGFDSIIIAMGSKSYNPLEEELKGTVKELYVIGDAKSAGQANKATEEAAAVAFRL